jgi:hypothetical protein
MVKRLTGFGPVLSLHKPLHNSVEEYLMFARERTPSFLKSPERETAFLPFPARESTKGETGIPPHDSKSGVACPF